MKNTLLLILDGFGIAPNTPSNAIYQAKAPTLQKLLALPEMVEIDASGRSVGLPTGFIGNSEVGHLNIGAGTIVYQDMTKIDLAIEEGTFFENEVITELLASAKEKNGRVHFLGLLSDGGVHSHISHLHALLQLAQKKEVPAYVHAFLDGRDTPPSSGAHYVQKLLPMLEETNGKLATLCGRFYAMDRDNRWERVKEAYDLLTSGNGIKISDPIQTLEEAYKFEEFDEFVKPRILDQEGTIQDNDVVFFFNFRADRARELGFSLSSEHFDGFERAKFPKIAGIAGMTLYESKLSLKVAFPKQNLKNTIGERLSDRGIKQLRIAETEKYAHVTYFFNGGREEPFPNEDRVLIPSPKEVATYDLKPEMSANDVTTQLIDAIKDDKYQFVVCNLANPDMVGHTGIMPAAINAVEFVNECVERILAVIAEKDWKIIITSDHGNVECMMDENGNPQTAHTLNKTPLIVIEGATPIAIDRNEHTKLADIAKLI